MGERIEIYAGRRGLHVRRQWRWRWVAANGNILGVSSEGYNNYLECKAIAVRLTQALGLKLHGQIGASDR